MAISGGAGFLSSSANLVVHRFSCTGGGGGRSTKKGRFASASYNKSSVSPEVELFKFKLLTNNWRHGSGYSDYT